MTIPNAVEVIRQVARHCGDRAWIGAGTVLSPEACQAVIAAGAEYVVSPITRPPWWKQRTRRTAGHVGRVYPHRGAAGP